MFETSSRNKSAEESGSNGSAGHAFRSALRHVAELREYAAYFLSAKVDSVKLSVRKVAIYAALGVVGLMAGGALVVSAIVLLCWGLAGAFAAIFGVWWLGYIIMGVLLMVVLGAGIGLGLKRITGQWKRATEDKYEQRRERQQTEFGHNVHERAAGGH